jgi:cystathionine gamma-synthase
MKLSVSPVTVAVRSGIASEVQHGAVVPPLHLSSNFTFSGYGEKRQYDYTRSGNPTRDVLANALSELEGGAGAVITSSGMAALTLILQLLLPGDLMIAPHDCYGGTFRLLRALAARGQFKLRFIDQTKAEELRQIEAIKPRLILVETPSNPLLRVTDIAAMSAIANKCGALLAVDNTFLSPALQNPLALGADLVVHSTTKYINGHSDVVGGAVVAATADLFDELGEWANCLGIAGAPFDSFLTMRGIRTLQIRVRQHQENAQHLAELLNCQPGIRRVHYPGLESHPGHELAKRQQSGFGGMLSFELAGGEDAVRAFVEGLQHFSLAESLGGVESLVCHPQSMTHASLSPEDLTAAGISPDLIRLSVGIENVDDLAADVLNALAKAANATRYLAIA